jgi:hypothetical protein
MLLLKFVAKSFNPIRLTILSERDIIRAYHQSAGQRFFETVIPISVYFFPQLPATGLLYTGKVACKSAAFLFILRFKRVSAF